MKILFIHRSVGHNLIKEGDLRPLLKQHDIELDDYDNNLGELTHSGGTVSKGDIVMPGNNTNPDNLADYFSNWKELLDSYDTIMIKSCYPNSHVKDEQQLETIKAQYTSIIDAFRKHNKPLIILTTPPLRPLFTNETEAMLANKLTAWLVDSADKQLAVIDFHNLLAEETGRHNGMLKSNFRRLLPFDNHPNRKANRLLGPQIVGLIAQTMYSWS